MDDKPLHVTGAAHIGCSRRYFSHLFLPQGLSIDDKSAAKMKATGDELVRCARCAVLCPGLPCLLRCPCRAVRAELRLPVLCLPC